MVFNSGERVRPILALNAVRVITPPGALPACLLPYDRGELHTYLDRAEQDVFAIRHGRGGMAVIPLRQDAVLPDARISLTASEHLGLVAALAREAVFRLLVSLADGGYRVTRRRPPTVETSSVRRQMIWDILRSSGAEALVHLG